jgi:hypothetical protein
MKSVSPLAVLRSFTVSIVSSGAFACLSRFRPTLTRTVEMTNTATPTINEASHARRSLQA